MIIEIKDLPNNRDVKKITFDIEFEDGEVSTVNEDVTIRPRVDEDNDITFDDPVPPMQSTNLNQKTTPEGPNFRSDERPTKEIPDEMQNLEF